MGKIKYGKDSHFYKHGLSNTKEYRKLNSIYGTMKCRCYNPNNKKYKNYGARGITVCDEWLHDFMNFYNWAMANGYKEGLSLDRINNDGNYEPSNCRWATNYQQANNKTTNHYITYNNETHSMREWSDILNINYSTIRARIRYGLPLEKVFLKDNFLNKNSKKVLKINTKNNKIVAEYSSINEAAKLNNVSRFCIQYRCTKNKEINKPFIWRYANEN